MSGTASAFRFYNAGLRNVYSSCVLPDRDTNGARNNFFAAYGIACGIHWDGVAH